MKKNLRKGKAEDAENQEDLSGTKEKEDCRRGRRRVRNRRNQGEYRGMQGRENPEQKKSRIRKNHLAEKGEKNQTMKKKIREEIRKTRTVERGKKGKNIRV